MSPSTVMPRLETSSSTLASSRRSRVQRVCGVGGDMRLPARGRPRLPDPNVEVVGSRGKAGGAPVEGRARAVALEDRPCAAWTLDPELVLRARAACRGGAELHRGPGRLGRSRGCGHGHAGARGAVWSVYV